MHESFRHRHRHLLRDLLYVDDGGGCDDDGGHDDCYDDGDDEINSLSNNHCLLIMPSMRHDFVSVFGSVVVTKRHL